MLRHFKVALVVVLERMLHLYDVYDDDVNLNDIGKRADVNHLII